MMPVPEVLRQYPEVEAALSLVQYLGRPLLFLALFLFIGVIFGVLVRRVTTAAGSSEDAYETAGLVVRRVAIGDVVVWGTALIIASEAVGLTWFAGALGPFFGLLDAIVTGVVWVVALTALGLVGGYVFTSATGHGREIPLSLLGWWSLKRDPNRPDPEQEFDLGDGRMARVSNVSLLHTTFTSREGWSEVRPNWWLMEKHFNWARPKGAEVEEATAAETAPPVAEPIGETGPVPPPEPPPVWSPEVGGSEAE